MIYNPCIETVNVNGDVKIDEKNLYNKSFLSLWELADDDWSSSYDILFADPNKFDKDTPKFPEKIIPSLIFSSNKTASSENKSAREEVNNESTQQNFLKNH